MFKRIIRGLINRLPRAKHYPSPFWNEANCLFGLSTGRCGTTTLANLLNTHSYVRAYHEPPPGVVDPVRVRPFYEFPQNVEDIVRQFTECRQTTISDHLMKDLVYAEVNGLKFHLPVIQSLMPNAKFFFVHRHPLDFIRSGMRRGWYKSHPADVMRLRPRESDEAFDSWDSWTRFEKIAWLWHATNAFFIENLDQLDQSRYEVFAFNQLMQPSTGDWKRLFRLMSLELPIESRIEEVLTVRFNEQVGGEDFELDELDSQQIRQLENIAGHTMALLGYDCNEITS